MTEKIRIDGPEHTNEGWKVCSDCILQYAQAGKYTVDQTRTMCSEPVQRSCIQRNNDESPVCRPASHNNIVRKV